MRFQWTYLRLDKYGQFLWIVNLQRTLTTGLANSGVRILIENLQKNSGRVCLVAGGDLRQVPAAVRRLLGHDQPEGRPWKQAQELRLPFDRFFFFKLSVGLDPSCFKVHFRGHRSNYCRGLPSISICQLSQSLGEEKRETCETITMTLFGDAALHFSVLTHQPWVQISNAPDFFMNYRVHSS